MKVALHGVGAEQEGCELIVDDARGGAVEPFTPADDTIFGDEFDEPDLALFGPALRPAEAGLDGGFEEEGFDGGDTHWRGSGMVVRGSGTAAAAGRRGCTPRVMDGW